MPLLLHVPTPKHTAMLICVAAMTSLVGCGSSLPLGECAAPRSIAVEVAVRDSISGAPAADGAFGTLVSASVNDTLEHVDALTLAGGEHLGTYTVTIDRPGYLTWRRSGVRVTGTSFCGNVTPVALDAKLQPATP